MALSIVLGACNCTAVDMFGLRPRIIAESCLLYSSWYAFCTAESPELDKVRYAGTLSENANTSSSFPCLTSSNL